jgi:hypothetical protein
MRRRNVLVVSLFGCAGLASGVLTVALSHLSPLIFWFGVSLILTLALAGSLMVSQAAGLISVVTSWRRYTISALIMTVAYPVTLLIAIEVAFLYSWLYKTMVSQQIQATTADLENVGFFVGLVLAAVLGALLTSAALTILTHVWSKKIALFMVMSGVGTLLISTAIRAIFVFFQGYFSHEDNTIIIVGDMLFGGLCGYWLVYACPHHAGFGREAQRPEWRAGG